MVEGAIGWGGRVGRAIELAWQVRRGRHVDARSPRGSIININRLGEVRIRPAGEGEGDNVTRSFVLPVSLQDAVVQKVEEIPPTLQTTCNFGDPHPHRRGTSRLRRTAGPGHLPPRFAPLNRNETTDGAD